MKKQYQIAAVRLLISSDLTIQNDELSVLFETTVSEGKADFHITIQVASLPEYPGEKELYTRGKRKTFVLEDRLVSYYREPNRRWQFCYEEGKDSGKLIVLPEFSHYTSDIRNIWNKIDLSRILLRQGGLILHASYIIWNGCGILFTAPSGTGKSTQAGLWEKYRGAEIINGDRAVIRKWEGRQRAYSLPFSGTSGICRNVSCPLQAIVVLGQAKTNILRYLSDSEAVKYLYSQCAVNRWNGAEVSLVMDLLQKLVREVPVLRLDCLPDESAVEVLEKCLKKYEERGKEIWEY